MSDGVIMTNKPCTPCAWKEIDPMSFFEWKGETGHRLTNIERDVREIKELLKELRDNQSGMKVKQATEQTRLAMVVGAVAMFLTWLGQWAWKQFTG